MNRLIALACHTAKILKSRYSSAIRFDFSIEMDSLEFNPDQLNTEFLQALQTIEKEQLRGWCACEKYFLECVQTGQKIELNKKEYIIKEITDGDLCQTQ